MSYNRKRRGTEKDKVVFLIAESLASMPVNYQKFIEDIKSNIKNQRIKAHLSANKAMIMMYWNIGKAILEQQDKEGWGTKVIDRMSHDIKDAFPNMTGFSPRNLKYMRKFADAWPDEQFVQLSVAQIPWRSNITLLDYDNPNGNKKSIMRTVFAEWNRNIWRTLSAELQSIRGGLNE